MASVESSRPSARRRARHDPQETEREILAAAEQLLRERPFREITVERIMSRTELKRPAFYVHFRDRHDVVLRVLERIVAELFEMESRWLEGDQPDADVRAALEGAAAVWTKQGPVLLALGDAARLDARAEAAYQQLAESLIDATARHIRDEQAAGRIGELDVEETARALCWLNERYFTE